jgi:hypothetical protein
MSLEGGNTLPRIAEAEHDNLAPTFVKKSGNYVWNQTLNGGLGDWERWDGLVDIDVSAEGLATEATLAKTVGIALPEYDSITATYNDVTFTEVYVYTLGGVTKATITVIYVDATKKKLVSMVRA